MDCRTLFSKFWIAISSRKIRGSVFCSSVWVSFLGEIYGRKLIPGEEHTLPRSSISPS